jgi:hypothetical protein
MEHHHIFEEYLRTQILMLLDMFRNGIERIKQFEVDKVH